MTARTHDAFWTVQGVGLTLMAGTSFFPALYHWQEYGFFLLLLLSVGMTVVGMRTSPWVRTPLDVPVLCFLGWVLCTVPFATDVMYSLSEWRKFLAHVVVFYWGLLVFREHGSERLPQRVLTAVMVGSLLLSAYSVADFVIRGGTWRDRYVRAIAPGSDYNWLSTYMVLSVPVVAGLLFAELRGTMRLGGVLALASSLLAQLVSYGRAGWLGHAAQALTVGLLSNRRRHVLLVIALALTLTMGLVLLSQVGFQRDTVDRWTLMSRMAVWELGLRDIVEHPLVGIGYGNNTFVKRHPEYAPEVQARLQERDRIPPSMHSAFLMVTLGSGLPALVFFCWIFVRLLRALLCRLDEVGRASSALLALTIALAVIGFGVRNLFDYMFMGSLSHLFWILAAAGLTLRTSCAEQAARKA